MSGAIRAALDTEQARARATLDTSLKHWAATVGHPIAQGSIRTPTAPVATLGQNSAQWLGALPC
jgi:hypothetical protein